jgi:hypothetical protein
MLGEFSPHGAIENDRVDFDTLQKTSHRGRVGDRIHPVASGL